LKKKIIEKKFSTNKYDDKYIMKCLQKDILDFQEYTKEQIYKNKNILEDLIKFIEQSVYEIIPDYEVKLYGSHATNLCLPWSDLDIVLIHKKNPFAYNYTSLQNLYLTLLDKAWIKSIKLIDGAIIPIIKINTTEEFNNMQIDISIQDGKHFGLKCVELVKTFMNEFEALEPLIFSLKNLLKNANLNDPYTVT
jgi:DNA polymerase sigma